MLEHLEGLSRRKCSTVTEIIRWCASAAQKMVAFFLMVTSLLQESNPPTRYFAGSVSPVNQHGTANKGKTKHAEWMGHGQEQGDESEEQIDIIVFAIFAILSRPPVKQSARRSGGNSQRGDEVASSRKGKKRAEINDLNQGCQVRFFGGAIST